MQDSDRFLKLAQASSSKEQAALFMQQHFRLKTREKIDNCRACCLGGRNYCQGFSGKTPCFLSFVSKWPINNDGRILIGELLRIVGYKLEDVCFISLISCRSESPIDHASESYIESCCRDNFNWQMSLSSSRVYVMLGEDCFHYVTGDRNSRIGEFRSQWFEQKNSAGARQFVFLTDYPYSRNTENLKSSFGDLGTLLHYAWATQMQEFYPGSSFEHKMTYEQICDVVANDIKIALMNIPAEKRTDEFMRLMLRVCNFPDPSGLASRAFWDNGMAERCGIDTSGEGWWTDKFMK